MNTAGLCLSVAVMVFAVPGAAVTIVDAPASDAVPAAATAPAVPTKFVPPGAGDTLVLHPLAPAKPARVARAAAAVGLDTVPDPGIWMMGLIGLGIVAASLRARQRLRGVLS